MQRPTTASNMLTIAQRLRQSFSKYNLFNLARSKPLRTQFKTFFQQKWAAKAETRNYHGETIREKQWTRMFQRGTSAVVPMDHRYLAEHDGSEQAEGRGSGLDSPSMDKRKSSPKIPFMNMVYAPAERRLDTSIFRALFASSTRQARQFVVHGEVKVNGKKMTYPGYQLNPGDMFQVEPERVLYALGAPKDRAERQAGRRMRMPNSKSKEAVEAKLDVTKSQENTHKLPTDQSVSMPADASTSLDKSSKESLQSLLTQAKKLLSTNATSLTARRKQDLRAFQRSVKRVLPRPDDLSAQSLDTQLQDIISRIPQDALDSGDSSHTEAVDTPKMSTPALQAEAASLTKAQMLVLRNALKHARDNPVDPSKPYATPWRPREYLSPFVFIPPYLEVHQRICSAVYLRHPVARPGLAEVPTPFSPETLSLAHNWYLRRR